MLASPLGEIMVCQGAKRRPGHATLPTKAVSSQSAVLLLKSLQPLGLLRAQPAYSLRHLWQACSLMVNAHAARPTDWPPARAPGGVAQEDFSLPQLAEDHLRGVTPSGHVVLPPVVHDTWPSPALSYKLDRFLGGRSDAQSCKAIREVIHERNNEMSSPTPVFVSYLIGLRIIQ